MELASNDLQDHYAEFDSEFQNFFPDIIKFTAEFEFVKR